MARRDRWMFLGFHKWRASLGYPDSCRTSDKEKRERGRGTIAWFYLWLRWVESSLFFLFHHFEACGKFILGWHSCIIVAKDVGASSVIWHVRYRCFCRVHIHITLKTFLSIQIWAISGFQSYWRKKGKKLAVTFLLQCDCMAWPLLYPRPRQSAEPDAWPALSAPPGASPEGILAPTPARHGADALEPLSWHCRNDSLNSD